MILNLIMTKSLNNSRIEQLYRDIMYHHKAINLCNDNFPYLTSIKTSLAEEYAQLGHELYKTKDYHNALNAYNKTIRFNPLHLPAYHQIGLIYNKLCIYESALAYFNQIISLATMPKDIKHKADAYLTIALILIAENKHGCIKKAYKNIQEAQKIFPSYSYIQKVKTIVNNKVISEHLLLDVNYYLNLGNLSAAKNYLAQAEKISTEDNKEVLKLRKKLREQTSLLTLTKSNFTTINNKEKNMSCHENNENEILETTQTI